MLAAWQDEGLDEYHNLWFCEDGFVDLIRQGAQQSVGATREAKTLSYLASSTWSPLAATKQSASIAQEFREGHWGENASVLLAAFRRYEFQRHHGEQVLPHG